MTRTTLRSFLRAHAFTRFAFRGREVEAQDLVNHYSVYLEAQVESRDGRTYFVTSRGLRPTPFVAIPAA